MKELELLRAFLQVPELSTVGTAEERAAFIALRIEGCTVREAGEAIGLSKSHVTNLANLFQAKLSKKMVELQKKGSSTWSAECRTLYRQLAELMPPDYDWAAHKIGNFLPGGPSQEDWAEIRGTPVRNDFDD